MIKYRQHLLASIHLATLTSTSTPNKYSYLLTCRLCDLSNQPHSLTQSTNQSINITNAKLIIKDKNLKVKGVQTIIWFSEDKICNLYLQFLRIIGFCDQGNRRRSFGACVECGHGMSGRWLQRKTLFSYTPGFSFIYLSCHLLMISIFHYSPDFRPWPMTTTGVEVGIICITGPFKNHYL